MSPRTRFDAAYYARFYGSDPAGRASSEDETRRLARFVSAWLQHLGLPVERALDLGCGLGWWRAELERQFEGLEYTGVEHSAYLCREHDFTRGSVVDFEGDGTYDLVICQGVLQYLPATQARRAIRNLARLTRGALYLEVLTREDWDHNTEHASTDGKVHLRPARWYREQLEGRFTPLGGGVFLPAASPLVLYELERLPRP